MVGRHHPWNSDLYFKTEKYGLMFRQRMDELKFPTEGQWKGILRDLAAEEMLWLESQPTEYDDIQEAQDVMDSIARSKG